MKGLVNTGVLGLATLIGWLLILTLAPMAAIQLWRFRRTGLYLAAMLSALASLYYLAGDLLFARPKCACSANHCSHNLQCDIHGNPDVTKCSQALSVMGKQNTKLFHVEHQIKKSRPWTAHYKATKEHRGATLIELNQTD